MAELTYSKKRFFAVFDGSKGSEISMETKFVVVVQTGTVCRELRQRSAVAPRAAAPRRRAEAPP